MKIRRKIKIIFGKYGPILAILAIYAINPLIPSQKPVPFSAVIFAFVIIYGLDFLLSHGVRKYNRLMKYLPGDHKLIGVEVSAVDIGNIRFNYSVYSKAVNKKQTDVLVMNVHIPFPVEDEAMTSSIKQDMEDLMKELRNDTESVFSCVCFQPSGLDRHKENTDEEPEEESDENEVNEVELVGWTLYLEFALKKLTGEKLSSLQDKFLSIVERYGLNDHVLCTVEELEDQTVYYQNIGNIEVSSVQILKDNGKRICFSCRRNSRGYFYKSRESIYSPEAYRNLLNITREIECNLDIDSIEPAVKNIFKGLEKNVKASFFYANEGARVDVSLLAGNQATVKFYIIESSGCWWIYAWGPDCSQYPVSVEKESDACYLLLVMIDSFVARYVSAG